MASAAATSRIVRIARIRPSHRALPSRGSRPRNPAPRIPDDLTVSALALWTEDIVRSYVVFMERIEAEGLLERCENWDLAAGFVQRGQQAVKGDDEMDFIRSIGGDGLPGGGGS